MIAPRVAVRVLLLDSQSRVLLFEGRDLSDHSDTDRWWFTVGGGVEPGETLRTAALREVEEETGITDIDLCDLRHRRDIEFMNHGAPLRQIEHFFAARTDAPRLSTERWTALEREAMITWR